MTLTGRRVDVKLLYCPGEDRKSVSWRSDQFEIRCGRENQHPAEWALRPPIEQLQLERRCWIEEHVPERLGPQAPVEQPRKMGKKRGYG